MKLASKLYIFLFSLLLIGIMGEKSFAISNYQIKKLCKQKKRELTCIKNLKEKKSDLENGKFIEIPVLPYKR